MAGNRSTVLVHMLNEEFLTCNICCEVYNDPRMLPCQHVMCGPCLKAYVKPNSRNFPCPFCQRKTDVPSGGIENINKCRFISDLKHATKLYGGTGSYNAFTQMSTNLMRKNAEILEALKTQNETMTGVRKQCTSVSEVVSKDAGTLRQLMPNFEKQLSSFGNDSVTNIVAAIQEVEEKILRPSMSIQNSLSQIEQNLAKNQAENFDILQKKQDSIENLVQKCDSVIKVVVEDHVILNQLIDNVDKNISGLSRQFMSDLKDALDGVKAIVSKSQSSTNSAIVNIEQTVTLKHAEILETLQKQEDAVANISRKCNYMNEISSHDSDAMNNLIPTINEHLSRMRRDSVADISAVIKVMESVVFQSTLTTESLKLYTTKSILELCRRSDKAANVSMEQTQSLKEITRNMTVLSEYVRRTVKCLEETAILNCTTDDMTKKAEEAKTSLRPVRDFCDDALEVLELNTRPTECAVLRQLDQLHHTYETMRMYVYYCMGMVVCGIACMLGTVVYTCFR